MLSLSYSQAISDPTYCDAGIVHGKATMASMGVKPNQPMPLKDIMPYCTLAEILWCLRAVKPSQKAEADAVARAFTESCLNTFYAPHDDIVISPDTSTLQYRKHKAAHAAMSDELPSQKAINISKAAIEIAELSAHGGGEKEETRQRDWLINELNKH